MFDIHMHIIPSVDDGSRDMGMSEAMLEQAWLEGIRAIIATPHSYCLPSAGKGHGALRRTEEATVRAEHTDDACAGLRGAVCWR